MPETLLMTKEEMTELAIKLGWPVFHAGNSITYYISGGRIVASSATCLSDLDSLRKAEEAIGLHDRAQVALRVKWINLLREAVSVECPKNKMGAPLVTDVDLVNASVAHRLAAFRALAKSL